MLHPLLPNLLKLVCKLLSLYFDVAHKRNITTGIEWGPSCVGMTKMRGPPLTPPKEGKDCGNVILAKLAGIEWGPSCVGMTKNEGSSPNPSKGGEGLRGMYYGIFYWQSLLESCGVPPASG